MNWQNLWEKNPKKKFEKKAKLKVKLPHVIKKNPNQSRKQNFFQTLFFVFSFYFELGLKPIRHKNHSRFCSISCFGLTNFTSRIWLQISWQWVNSLVRKNFATLQCKFFERWKPWTCHFSYTQLTIWPPKKQR